MLLSALWCVIAWILIDSIIHDRYVYTFFPTRCLGNKQQQKTQYIKNLPKMYLHAFKSKHPLNFFRYSRDLHLKIDGLMETDYVRLIITKSGLHDYSVHSIMC